MELRYRRTAGVVPHTHVSDRGSTSRKIQRDHQITIDIMDLADSPENVLSTHTLWHRDEGMVRFDTITVKQFARKPKVKELTAETLSEALQAAIRIAVSAWNKPLWVAIARRQLKTPN